MSPGPANMADSTRAERREMRTTFEAIARIRSRIRSQNPDHSSDIKRSQLAERASDLLHILVDVTIEINKNTCQCHYRNKQKLMNAVMHNLLEIVEQV